MTYVIGSGDPQKQFDINPERGLLYIVAPLDRESVSVKQVLTVIMHPCIFQRYPVENW
jgi:hypothetical protein